MLSENKQALDAVVNNNIPLMKNLFKTGGINQESIENLIFKVNSEEMMKLFLLYGGDMHKIGPPGVSEPFSLLYILSLALKETEDYNLVNLIKFLIKEGVGINEKDTNGITVFWVCARYGQSELCKLLVERGADPSVTGNDGVTALHVAALNGHDDVCRYLVEDCGLDIEAMTSKLRTPLYLATREGRIDVCKYLLEKGAMVDAGRLILLIAIQVYTSYSLFRQVV
jgi:ankyrin repeat protein